MAELLEKIGEYWSTRTEGYSEVNQKELQGMQKEAWLSVLTMHFPKKDKENLKILDIGTGPGFFPIILSEAGYKVTAVDYTPAMLEKAKENAGTLGERITFMQMDAQNLEFESDSFDVVISRNLMWNLENPGRAYSEWHRVLKPGGVLLNFDANWYGYLYDDEKRKAYEQDRKNVKDCNLDDHYLCTDIDRMEEIAREIPLSAIKRPQWDIEMMEEIGFSGIKADTEIWRQVWSDEEKLNYGSTPMFMICGRKSAPHVLKLENLEVWPGEKVSGWLELGEGRFKLPVSVFNGEKPGKTILITAGVHAAEYVGIQTAMELFGHLKIEKVNGTVIIVKTVNRPAFEKRSGSEGLEDGKNLNRVFPGDPEGTEMEVLAHEIVTKLFPHVDYYIDLHSGDAYEQLTPYVYYAGKATEVISDLSRKMAQQVDVPYMVKSNVASGGAYNYAASTGIPSILIERGGMGAWTNEEVKSMRRDVRNILCYLGIYEDRKDYRQYYPLDVVDVCYQAASHDGLWYPRRMPGDMVTKGEILGEVRDYNGHCIEICRAEFDGVILYQTGSLQVTEAGPMITYGRIVKIYDDRKEKIVHYWGKRSDSFMEQKRAELHSAVGERWTEEIRRQLQGRQNLNILDVGCGSGFFSIMLAKKGHRVTGIDLTPEMITCAKELAKEEHANCKFLVMDAEKLEFEDHSFDVVISRNLTWTLPDAAAAYQEWIRVLKPDGLLLNFDANYGISNFLDKAELPENHAHYILGDEMMKECEEIKRQLPISSYSRPAWDLEVLGQMGLTTFSIDLGLGKRIYIEKDEFYNPTPMFMLSVRKD